MLYIGNLCAANAVLLAGQTWVPWRHFGGAIGEWPFGYWMMSTVVHVLGFKQQRTVGVVLGGSVFCGLCPSSCYRFVVYGKPNVVCPSFQVVCPRQLYIFQGELYMFILYYDDIFNQAESFDETLSIISFKTAHLTIRERYVSASRL